MFKYIHTTNMRICVGRNQSSETLRNLARNKILKACSPRT
ncbi:rCG30644 [Rattus norvegicus]|uniref:RCG30644 n=1 Tax=Rattus norvegicus TaxID=10116 RepID=A6IUP6_RAT|nr:rCG30644 [Rattus norvegicus]